jgi:SNF2 family DNA or RNA helicase
LLSLSVSVSVSLILPLQIEIIVPISLSPLQKHVYKGVLEKNAELLEAILESRKKRLKAATRA